METYLELTIRHCDLLALNTRLKHYEILQSRSKDQVVVADL